jgi:hypothetical protein
MPGRDTATSLFLHFYVPYDLSMTQPDIDLSIIIAAYNEG